ncbi:MAG TPA: hypothetical protein VG651_07945 [Stellaceae bacterium]|nr:hypothetical protein [Stellaceae bacterium]
MAGARLGLARPTARQVMVLAGLALAGAVLGVEWWRNLRLDAYLDHIEGNIVIGGWLWWANWPTGGAPIYALQDGYAQFANIYGPLAYLAALPGLWLCGPGIVASKLPAGLALLATIGLTAYRLRRAAPMTVVQGMFLLVAGFAALSPMSFWTRADPFEALLVAGGLAAAASPIAVGLCIGLAVNCKIHAFLYFLPVLWELWSRRGRRAAPLLIAAALAAFLTPFLLPGISLHDYLAILAQQVGGRTRGDALLLPVAAYGIAFALPVLLPLCRHALPREARHYAVATLITLALIAYPATFPGAGPYHFLPLLPVLAEARRRLAPTGVGSEFAVFPLLFFAAVTTPIALGQLAERQDWHAYAAEALALAREAPPGTVDIGYGDNKRSYEIAQLAKAELSLHGYPRAVDAQILMELRKTGVDGSRRWIPYLTDCRVRRWLLPRGEAPFAVNSYFYDNGAVFGPAFRDAFTASYRPVRDRGHFTVWECVDGR